jgi:hypothetical protein
MNQLHCSGVFSSDEYSDDEKAEEGHQEDGDDGQEENDPDYQVGDSVSHRTWDKPARPRKRNRR